MTVYGDLVVEHVITRRSNVVAETLVAEQVTVIGDIIEGQAEQFENFSASWDADGQTWRGTTTYTFHPYAFED